MQEQPEHHCEHEVALTSGDEEKEISRMVAGRNVKLLFFEDALGACFQDSDGRFCYFNVATQELTELAPGSLDPKAPIPAEAWHAFGTLLGLVLLRRSQEDPTGDGGWDEPSAEHDSVEVDGGEDGIPQGDLNGAGRKASLWPDFLAGYGEKSIASFSTCGICRKETWVRYGGRALCRPCADRSARQAERVVEGVQTQSKKEKPECTDQYQNMEHIPSAHASGRR